MTFRVIEDETGGKFSFRFRALCATSIDEQRCGYIEATRAPRKVAGRVVYKVTNVFVDESRRRQGIATKLYEAAAREACRRRGRLASTERNPGAHSNDFWRKQFVKGRAFEHVPRGTNHAAYVLRDCPSPALDGVRRR